MSAESSNISDPLLKQLVECPICYEYMREARILKCGHRMCSDCCKKIHEQEGFQAVVCGQCRARYSMEDVIKDFTLSRKFLVLFVSQRIVFDNLLLILSFQNLLKSWICRVKQAKWKKLQSQRRLLLIMNQLILVVLVPMMSQSKNYFVVLDVQLMLM